MSKNSLNVKLILLIVVIILFVITLIYATIYSKNNKHTSIDGYIGLDVDYHCSNVFKLRGKTSTTNVDILFDYKKHTYYKFYEIVYEINDLTDNEYKSMVNSYVKNKYDDEEITNEMSLGETSLGINTVIKREGNNVILQFETASSDTFKSTDDYQRDLVGKYVYNGYTCE